MMARKKQERADPCFGPWRQMAFRIAVPLFLSFLNCMQVLLGLTHQFPPISSTSHYCSLALPKPKLPREPDLFLGFQQQKKRVIRLFYRFSFHPRNLTDLYIIRPFSQLIETCNSIRNLQILLCRLSFGLRDLQ